MSVENADIGGNAILGFCLAAGVVQYGIQGLLPLFDIIGCIVSGVVVRIFARLAGCRSRAYLLIRLIGCVAHGGRAAGVLRTAARLTGLRLGMAYLLPVRARVVGWSLPHAVLACYT